MLKSLVVGIGGVVGIMLVWIAVQRLWGKVFAEHLSDEDVMAGRSTCGNCGCATVCERKKERGER